MEANVLVWKLRDKQNKTAFAYACEFGDIETIKAFLESSQGKIKINIQDKLTATQLAPICVVKAGPFVMGSFNNFATPSLA